jgi:hypothetical protein
MAAKSSAPACSARRWWEFNLQQIKAAANRTQSRRFPTNLRFY